MADRRKITQIGKLVLAITLLGVLCTAGYRRGYQAGYTLEDLQQADGGEAYLTTYPVGDLVVPVGLNPKTEAGRSAADFDPLINLIMSTIEHDSWLENGAGEGEIQPFPSNLSLVVAQTRRVHGQIRELLDQLRSMRGDVKPALWVHMVQSLAACDRSGSQCVLQYPGNEGAKAAIPAIFARSVDNTVKLWGKPTYRGMRSEYGFPQWCDADEIAYWPRGEGYAYLGRKSVTSQDQPAVLQFIAGWHPADK